MPGPSWLQPVLQSLDMQFSTQTSTYQDGNSQLSSQTRIPGRLLFGGTVEHECPGSTGEDARALLWGAMCWGQATPAHVFTPTKLLQNMGVTEIVQSMFLSLMIKPAQEHVLQVLYRTEQSQYDTAADAQDLPAVKLNVLPLGEAWKGENQFSTEPTTGIWRSSPCKAQSNTGEKSPQGDELPQGTTGLMVVASPLPAVVLRLLSEAEAVLPVSLF